MADAMNCAHWWVKDRGPTGHRAWLFVDGKLRLSLVCFRCGRHKVDSADAEKRLVGAANG